MAADRISPNDEWRVSRLLRLIPLALLVLVFGYNSLGGIGVLVVLTVTPLTVVGLLLVSPMLDARMQAKRIKAAGLLLSLPASRAGKAGRLDINSHGLHWVTRRGRALDDGISWHDVSGGTVHELGGILPATRMKLQLVDGSRPEFVVSTKYTRLLEVSQAHGVQLHKS